MKQSSQRGGFTAQNSGSITDCYSLMEVNGSKASAGGFTAANKGTITCCFAVSSLKELSGGFAASQGGTLTSCYFFHKEKKGSAVLKRLCDGALGQPADDLTDSEKAAGLGFSMDDIWAFGGKKAPLMFKGENWMYDIRNSSLYSKLPSMKHIIIKTADELRQFAKLVNDGDRSMMEAYVTLGENINLGGKPWEPIGRDRTHAFCGLFDGGGHTVKNFTITSKQGDNLGFFGILKGHVYNLSIDCSIKDGAAVGAFAAQCEGGIIGCCSAVSELSGKSGLMGGFVGSNTGRIFQCYSAGRIRTGRKLIPLIVGNGVLVVLILLLLILPSAIPGFSLFAPVPYDDDIVPIEDDTAMPKTDGNFVSFQFDQTIEVNRSTGMCKFNFKNPGESNHNIVVQLQFTDAQAKRVMGSTGRSAEEQKRLESDASYDPELSRMVLAESGSIPPGYEMSDLKLVKQDNGATLPAGKYNAMVYLLFYDIKTNARAMLESQLPVVISVE